VVSHDAIALEAYSLEPALAAKPLLVHTDARRGEVYWALYGGLDRHGLPVLLSGPSVGKYAEVTANLAEEFGEYSERTQGATADWLARLARKQLAEGFATDDVTALYLRAPDATMPKPNQQFGKRVSDDR
jgi:tRNA A37 threonylcarbamoyladenosine modification protein TsaB